MGLRHLRPRSAIEPLPWVLAVGGGAWMGAWLSVLSRPLLVGSGRCCVGFLSFIGLLWL